MGSEEIELREFDPIVRERIPLNEPDPITISFIVVRLLLPITSDSVSAKEEAPK